MTETTGKGKTTRAQRLAMPLAREVVRDLAVEHGACIRPVQLRRRNLDTGEIDTVLVPCGNTLASVCPACAERAKTLRAAQCREGWHLEDEPDIIPDPATDAQKWWITQRAETQQARDLIAATGGDTTDFDELITELDDQITNAGIRGKAAPAKPARRHRSTRRRQDAPDLPKRKVSPRREILAPWSRKDARDTLRADLTCAVEDEVIPRNPVAVIRLPAPRKHKRRVWTVDEARRFLESSRRDEDALYTAFVLILVLGLRKCEVLGLTWDRVDLEAAELYVGEQLQRVTGQLIRRQVKTESSEAPLPLPELCITALKLRSERQAADRERAGDVWVETGLVFTSRHGTPVEPSNFDRSFDRRIAKAAVPKITRHSTRKTCGSLLAALEVHPRVAMQILRHSKIAITMEIYTEVPSAATREALYKLGQWLDETGT